MVKGLFSVLDFHIIMTALVDFEPQGDSIIVLDRILRGPR